MRLGFKEFIDWCFYVRKTKLYEPWIIFDPETNLIITCTLSFMTFL